MSFLAIDYPILQSFQAIFLHPFLDPIMLLITLFGNPLTWFFIASMVYLYGKEREGFHLMNLVMFSVVLIGAFKEFFHRPRPLDSVVRVLAIEPISRFSFPSGHATIIASVLGYYATHKKKIFALGLLILTILVAFSRMYLGVHFLTDLIAGMILGIVVGFANREIFKRFQKHHFRLSKLEDEVIVAFIILFAIAVLNINAIAEIVGLSVSFPDYAIIYASLFLGWYAGFFTRMELKHYTTALNWRSKIIKMLVGVNGILFFSTFILLTELPQWIEFILLFLLGAYLSLFLPLLYGKVVEVQNRMKSAKKNN